MTDPTCIVCLGDLRVATDSEAAEDEHDPSVSNDDLPTHAADAGASKAQLQSRLFTATHNSHDNTAPADTRYPRSNPSIP